MKYLLMFFLLSMTSCLPQEKGRSEGFEAQRLKIKPCEVDFKKEYSFLEIASTARKMKMQCEFGREEVLKRAKQIYELALE